MQTIALDKFWSRYGKTEFEETEFHRALDRLPSVSADGPWVAGGSVRRIRDRAEDQGHAPEEGVIYE